MQQNSEGRVAGRLDFITDCESFDWIVNELSHKLLQAELRPIGCSGIASREDLVLLNLDFGDANAIQEFIRYFVKHIVTGAFSRLAFAVYEQCVVVLGHGQSGVAGVSGQILTARKDNEAVRVRMRVAGRETPVGKLFQEVCCVVAFRRAALERKSGRLLRPSTAPVENIVVWKVVPRGLSLKWHWRELRVIPNQRPKVFRVNLIKPLQPLSDTLRL